MRWNLKKYHLIFDFFIKKYYLCKKKDMKHFTSINPNGSTTVVVNGHTFMANLQPEQIAILTAILSSTTCTFQMVENFFNSIFNIVPSAIPVETTGTVLRDSGLFNFSIENNQTVVKRNGINMSLPTFLLESYADIIRNKESIVGLDAFVYRQALCPAPFARQDSYTFLKNGGFILLPNGLFLAGRGLVTVSNYSTLIAEWVEVAKKWKRKLRDIEIYDILNGEFKLFDISNKNVPNGIFIGNLQDIVNGDVVLDKTYTDKWTHSFKIKMGQVVAQPRSECDHDRDVTCSKGLHFASIDKFNQTSYGQGWGDASVLVAIDPMDLVAIPHADGYWKGRCCRYLPLMEVERDDNGNLILPEMSVIQKAVESYGDYTLNQLKAKVENTKILEIETNFFKSTQPKFVSTNDLFEKLATLALNQETPTIKDDLYDDWYDEYEEEEEEDWFEYDDDDDDF